MGFPHPSHDRETPILSQYFGDIEARSLAGWQARGGYASLEKALGMDPVEIQNCIKDSGLRGRGGAGFPTGIKWSFMKPDGKQHYLCCNADESEPGTFKDREIMRWTPHALGGRRGDRRACDLCRDGVHLHSRRVHGTAAHHASRRRRGVRRGDPRRECDGHGQAHRRARASWRRRVHLRRRNRADELARRPARQSRASSRRSPQWQGCSASRPRSTTWRRSLRCRTSFAKARTGTRQFGRPDNTKSIGTKLFSVCGNIARPGNYEVAMGFPFKEFLYELCGGALPGREIKAVIPGGSSVPILTREEAEGAFMDYEGLVAAGTMLGSGGVIVFDDRQDMVRQIARLARFYAHESCAQCSQCREGTAWTTRILERIADGQGTRGRLRHAAVHRRQHDGQDDLRAE